MDPADPETVLVSAAASPWKAHNPTRADSTIYRKEAGGRGGRSRTACPRQREG